MDVGRVTRQEEALRLAEELLADVELSRASTSKHVLKAMRLARLVRDEAAQAWLTFEIRGVRGTDEGRKWMSRTHRWTDKENKKGYWLSSLGLESSIAANSGALTALGNSSLSGDGVWQANRDRLNVIVEYTSNSTTIGRILAAVDAAVYEFAARVYYELMFSELQASLFEEARTSIDGLLTPVTGDILSKIDSIAERLTTGESEAVSQAMSTCRRIIDSVADELFPPSDQDYAIGAQALTVKKNNVLNRINAYIHQQGIVGSRASRIRRTLKDIYDRVSTGVHADVDPHEARYLFLSTYVVLGEILTLRQSAQSTDAETASE